MFGTTAYNNRLLLIHSEVLFIHPSIGRVDAYLGFTSFRFNLIRNRQVNYLVINVGDGRTVLITVSSKSSVLMFHCISLSLPLPQVLCGRGCEALLSGDLEGGHTDQGNAAGRAGH